MSSAYSISEYDTLLRKVFVTKATNKAGIYVFRVYILGVPSIVSIDDKVPTKNDQPIFANFGKDGSFWMPMLEKAYAKVYGN